jgi:hypothetical protein
LGWRNEYDVLQANDTSGAPNTYRQTFQIAERTLGIDIDDAVVEAGQALGLDGEGLALRLTHAGGIASLTVEVAWNADVLTINGITSQISGASVVQEAYNPGSAGQPSTRTYTLLFDTPLQQGTTEIGRVLGALNQDVPYGQLSDGLLVTVLAVNGVVEPNPKDRAIVVCRQSAAMRMPMVRLMTTDLAMFASLQSSPYGKASKAVAYA